MIEVLAANAPTPFETGMVTAVVVAVILGLFKGIDYIINKYRGPPPAAPPQWNDITGEHRLVPSSECAARHAKLAEEMRRGSDQFGSLRDSIVEVREETIGLRGDVKTGFASIPGDIEKATQAKMDRHEEKLHKD